MARKSKRSTPARAMERDAKSDRERVIEAFMDLLAHKPIEKIGFADIRFYKPGDSADPNLCGLEAHGVEIGNEDINQFETFVIEGQAAKT